MKKAELEQAKQRMEDSMIRSPVDGVIALVPFQVGDTVPDGSRVAVIEDRTKFQVNVQVENQQARYLTETVSVDFHGSETSDKKSAALARADAKVILPLNLDKVNQLILKKKAVWPTSAVSRLK